MAKNLNNDEVLEKIKKLIKIINTNEKDITMETDVRELKVDSLDLLNYLFSIEETFSINIPNEAVEENNLFIVKSLIAYIQRS